VRHLETESNPRGGTSPGAAHSPTPDRVFRSGETCPEAGSKRALPSDKPGALPPENGFPLNNVRVRGQADP
jgi:hypothetical protein